MAPFGAVACEAEVFPSMGLAVRVEEGSQEGVVGPGRVPGLHGAVRRREQGGVRQPLVGTFGGPVPFVGGGGALAGEQQDGPGRDVPLGIGLAHPAHLQQRWRVRACGQRVERVHQVGGGGGEAGKGHGGSCGGWGRDGGDARGVKTAIGAGVRVQARPLCFCSRRGNLVSWKKRRWRFCGEKMAPYGLHAAVNGRSLSPFVKQHKGR